MNNNKQPKYPIETSQHPDDKPIDMSDKMLELEVPVMRSMIDFFNGGRFKYMMDNLKNRDYRIDWTNDKDSHA